MLHTREKRLSSKKSVTITGPYSVDLSLVVAWLRANNAISSSKSVKKSGQKYSVSVVPLKSKSEIGYLVKDRFGSFADVK